MRDGGSPSLASFGPRELAGGEPWEHDSWGGVGCPSSRFAPLAREELGAAAGDPASQASEEGHPTPPRKPRPSANPRPASPRPCTFASWPLPTQTPTADAGRTAWARNLATPVRDFLGTETGGAVVLVAAVVAALAWANVDVGSYEEVWETHLAISLGSHGIDTDLRAWVNEGLMTLFFLVVGLEAKREIDLGELRERTRVWIPAAAAFGGIAGAVGIYLLFNAGGAGGSGWGVAMSTDTALALGALALVVPSGSARLRVFLLTLVVVDDLAALAIIVIAYTDSVDAVALAVAAGLFAVLGLVRFLPTRQGPGRGARRRRDLGGDVRVRHRPGDRRPRDRAGDQRLPAAAPGPRARHRPDPRVPRAADPRARLLGAPRPSRRDLAQRAASSTRCTPGPAT